MSMCRVFSCVVGRGCLLWPARSLGKTLLAFAQKASSYHEIPRKMEWKLPFISPVLLTNPALYSTTFYFKLHFGYPELIVFTLALLAFCSAIGLWIYYYLFLEHSSLPRYLTTNLFTWLTSDSASLNLRCHFHQVISWLPTFAFQCPIMKRTFFGEC